MILTEIQKAHLQPLAELKMTKDAKILAYEEAEVEITVGESEFLKKEREQKEKEQRELENKQQKFIPRENPSRVEIIGESYEQCLQFAQHQGLPYVGVAYAKDYPINTDKPVEGGFVKTNESWAGHIAKITKVEENTITIIESNYLSGYLTQRVLPISSSIIAGFIY